MSLAVHIITFEKAKDVTIQRKTTQEHGVDTDLLLIVEVIC